MQATANSLVKNQKALHRRPTLLILDEPTAALGEQEAEQLGAHLLRLRNDGLAILYVTHLLGEVFAIADRVTILRDGLVVLVDEVAKVTPAKVIDAISPAAGLGLSETRTRGLARADGPAALELTEVVVDGVGPASLVLHGGEILVVFGLLGSGRTELLEGVYGSRRIASGSVQVGGRPLATSSPSARALAGRHRARRRRPDPPEHLRQDVDARQHADAPLQSPLSLVHPADEDGARRLRGDRRRCPATTRQSGRSGLDAVGWQPAEARGWTVARGTRPYRRAAHG